MKHEDASNQQLFMSFAAAMMRSFFSARRSRFVNFLQVSMTARAWVLKNRCVKLLVTFPFRDRLVAVALVNGGRFLWLISESNPGKIETLSVNMTSPTILEVIITFHCLSVFNNGVQNERLNVRQNYRAAALVDFFVEHLSKAWKELMTESQFTEFSK